MINIVIITLHCVGAYDNRWTKQWREIVLNKLFRVCGCENVLTQRKVRNLQKLQNVRKYSVSLRKCWLLLERGRCRPYFTTFCSHKHSFSHIFSSLLLALRMMKRISAAMAAVSAQPLSANYTTKYSQRGLGTSWQPCLKSRKYVVTHFDMSFRTKS